MFKKSFLFHSKRYFLLLFLSVKILGLVHAQFYSAGENAASLHWKHIKTENFNVIFSKGYEEQAQYAVNYLESAYQYAGNSLKHQPKRISIILQPDNASTNGFVTWAPKRSEMYVTPPQENEQNAWLDALLVHEYRHIVQVDKLNQGLTKVFYWLLGEQGVGLTVGLAMPLWFLEGDAVHTETMYTNGGRGTVPDFNLQLRTQLLQYGPYSYEKASFGSYKDIVADHYTLGYYLTDYARLLYGTDVWSGVVDRIGKFPIKPFRFSNALKQETGEKSKELYKSTMHYITSEWQDSSKTEQVYINPEPAVPVHYQFPVLLNDTIYALKRGLGNAGELISIIDSTEKHVLNTGYFNSPRLSVNNSFLVWTEEFRHVRWGQKSFSNLVVYDFQAEKRKQITGEQYFYSPFMHPEKNKIVAVENVDTRTRLVILNTEGQVLDTVENSEKNALLKQPVFISEEKIAVINFYKGKDHVELYDLKTKEKEVLLSSSFQIQGLHYSEGKLAYRARNDVANQIFLYNLKEDKSYCVTNSDFGSSDPFLEDSLVYFSEYTPEGYQLNRTTFSSEYPVTQNDTLTATFVDSMRLQSSGFVLSDSVPDTTYSIKKYRKGLHLFNLHSWQPVSYNLDQEGITTPEIGFKILSQNVLSTSFLTLGAEYNPSLQKESYYAAYTYSGFFPRLSIGYRHSIEKGLNILKIQPQDTLALKGKAIEDRVNLAISVPLLWNKAAYNYQIRTTVSVPYTNTKYQSSENISGIVDGDVLGTNVYVPADFSLVFSRSRRMSKRDLKPKFRQLVSAGYVQSLYSQKMDDQLYFVSGLLNFPGLLKHHSLQFYGAYQERLREGRAYSNQIVYPRGYSSVRFKEVTSLKVDYALPLFYPDWNISFLAYIQRVKMNLFYDYGMLYENASALEIASYGVDLSANVNFLRYYFIWDIGTRILYRDYDGQMEVSLLLSVDF